MKALVFSCVGVVVVFYLEFFFSKFYKVFFEIIEYFGMLKVYILFFMFNYYFGCFVLD